MEGTEMSENYGADTNNNDGAPENDPNQLADNEKAPATEPATAEVTTPLEPQVAAFTETDDANATMPIEQAGLPQQPLAETQPIATWQQLEVAPEDSAPETSAYQSASYQGPGYPSIPPMEPADAQAAAAGDPNLAAAPGYPASNAYHSVLPPAVTAHKAPRKKVGMGMFAASVLAAALIGAGAAGGTFALLNTNQSSAISSTGQQAAPIVVNNSNSVNAVTAAAAKAMPSVVTISATSGSSGGTGSGIILDTAGNILTNTHVVTLDGAAAHATISVQTSDGKVYAATIVGTDPLSDLAIVKIDAPNLVPAALGDSNKINVGDSVIAIGSPLGLNATVTEGIVSTLNRTIEVASSAVPQTPSDSSQTPNNGGNGFQFSPPGGSSGSSTATGTVYLNVIQTDAAINPGNSGGALVNSQGQVIGVNVAIASTGSSSSSSQSGNIGVGFSIPIDHAKAVADQIIATGSATHGQLGVSVQATAPSDGSTAFSVGATVANVTANSAAAKAGLQKGDIITMVGNRVISDPSDLTAAVREQSGGATVKVSFTRGGKAQAVDVTLDTMNGN